MGDASNLQTSFLSGEWSPYAQGRADDKEYRNGLALCSNGFPIETGAWTRRQGFRFAATTRLGQPAWLRSFAFAEGAPFQMEFTNQFLRLFSGTELVSTPDPQTVASINTANPVQVTTQGAHGWSNGANVQFIFDNSQAYPGAALLMNRQFTISNVATKTFTLTDPITGAGIDGSTITLPGSAAQVVRVNEIASPYTTTQLTTINRVQALTAQNLGVVVTLAPGVAPWTLAQISQNSPSTFATFSYAASVFLDGPYMDPAASGTLTPSGLSGSITLSGAPANTFVATDVGRMIRLFSEPLAYNAATAYVAGNTVKYLDGLYYSAIASSTGKAPNQYPALWAVNPTGAIWSWGAITAFNSGTNVTFTVKGPALLYTTAVSAWRLGLYSDTTGYPTCGVYHEGRLWLAGAQGNRFDASMSNDPFNMAPTASDGTVSDNNAISYVLNAEDTNKIYWMQPDNNGIVCGTKGGEWMIAASSLNDPLTPTSIQAHRRSKYKAANAQAVHAGFSVLFIQSAARKIVEYVADVFSGKFLGRNLMERARHLATTDVLQISYQQELNPILWGRTGAGKLIGTTYKRESSFTSEPPTINGWHQHTLGSGRVVESLSVGPSILGNRETLAIVTNDTNTNIRHVELLTDMFDETSTINDAWFLDDAVTPVAAVEATNGSTVTFYGAIYLAGFTVQVWAGGLDLGDYVVAADGSITVPLGSSSTTFPGLSLFTDAYLVQLENSGENFGGLGVILNRSVTVPYPATPGKTVQEQFPDAGVTHTPGFWAENYDTQETMQIGAGSASTDGMTICDRITGLEKRHVAASSIIYPSQTGSATLNFGAWSKKGFFYYCSNSQNNSVLRKLNTTTFQVVGSFGVSGSGFLQDVNHLAAMGSNCLISVQGHEYLFSASFAGPSNTFTVIDVDGMSWAGHTFTSTDTDPFQFCAGEQINNGIHTYSSAYSISRADTVIGFYRSTINAASNLYFNPQATTGAASLVLNTGVITTRVRGIPLSDIDATWTKFDSVAGLAYDQTDGNLIIAVFTLSAVTNTYYIVKINAATGAVIWKTAVPNASFQLTNAEMRISTIKYGTYSFLMGASTHYMNTVNTATGAITQNSFSGIGASGGVSNDTDGSVLFGGNFISGGDVTGIGGTVNFTNKVGRLQGFSQFPGQVTTTQSGVIPVVIGFTYTSQAAKLRDLAPDATGARQGPALGKTRRVHRFAALCANTQGISFGTDITGRYRLAAFKSKAGKGVTPLAVNQLYTGTYTDTLEDDYDLDSALSWKITRPYPATVTAAAQSLETMDR